MMALPFHGYHVEGSLHAPTLASNSPMDQTLTTEMRYVPTTLHIFLWLENPFGTDSKELYTILLLNF